MGENKKRRAYQLGKEAQQAGRIRVPAMDNRLLKECVSGNTVGESLPYLYAWLKGWDTANMKATVCTREVACRCVD
jgi:hypothetical protein